MRITRYITSNRELRRMRRLIDRYLEAETTVEEERRLFAAFASGRYPEELKEYDCMFADCAAVAGVSCKEAKVPSAKRRTARLIVSTAAVAAAVAARFVLHDAYNDARFEQIYSGSYIIVNGERIDDLKKIRPEIERTLARADAAEHKIKEQDIIERIENDMLNDISDSEERELIKKLIVR